MISYCIIDRYPDLIKRKIDEISILDDIYRLVGTASDAKSGLQMITALNPEMLIVDTSIDESNNSLLIEARKMIANNRVVALSSSSDFHHIRSLINAGADEYLIKPIKTSELTDVLKRISEEKIENSDFNNNKNQDTLAIKTSFDKAIEQSTILRDNERLRQYLIRAEQFTPELDSNYWSEVFNKSVYRLHLLVGHDRQKLLRMIPENLRWLEINRLPSVFLLIQCSHDYSNLIEGLTQAMRKISGKRFKSVSSSFLKDITELRKGFTECCSILDRLPVDVITPSCIDNKCSLNESRVSELKEFWNQEKNLILSIERGNSVAAVRSIDELFHFYETGSFFMSKSHFIDLGTVKRHVGGIVRQIRTLVHTYLGENFYGNEDSIFIQWSYDYTLLRDYVRNLVKNSAEALKTYSAYSSENPIDNIVDYLNKNYNQDITLEKLSELFYLNPSYCSTLFKKQTGINYSQYVNQLRIQEAKQLLLNDNISISRVAKMVGFRNDEYFFRVFKKLSGHTPNEFRQNYSEEV